MAPRLHVSSQKTTTTGDNVARITYRRASPVLQDILGRGAARGQRTGGEDRNFAGVSWKAASRRSTARPQRAHFGGWRIGTAIVEGELLRNVLDATSDLKVSLHF